MNVEQVWSQSSLPPTSNYFKTFSNEASRPFTEKVVERLDAPLTRSVSGSTSPTEITIVRVATFVYRGVWTLVGLAALLVGLNYPDELQSLTNLRQSWLGLAGAAGYSYFGINRNEA